MMISNVFIVVPFLLLLLLWQQRWPLLFAHAAFTTSTTISTRHNGRCCFVEKSSRLVRLPCPNQAEGRRRQQQQQQRRPEFQSSSLVLLAVQRELPLLRKPERSNNSRSCYDSRSLWAMTAARKVGHGDGRPRTITTTQLWYKTIDQDNEQPDNNDDPLLLKTQARTPPGFSVTRQAPHSIGGGINQRLMVALALNQLLILGLACVVGAVIVFVRTGFSFDFLTHLPTILDWTGTTRGNHVALFDFGPTPARLLYGVLGAIPLLAVSLWVERSDKTIFANLNFSTITMCLTLFGRRRAPPVDQLPPALQNRQDFAETNNIVAFIAAFLISGLTGFCEESVFRRIVPALLVQLLSSSDGGGGSDLPIVPVVLVGQAVLFALGHIQPGATTSRGENAVLAGLQLINGLGFGLLYLVTNADLPTTMICHAAYDTFEFYNTWSTANDQIEYADRQYHQDLDGAMLGKTRSMLARRLGGTKSIDPPLLDRLKRMFYIFDTDRNATLSRSEVRRGLAYMAVERGRTPPPVSVIDQAFDLVDEDKNERVDFAEFVNLYYSSGGGGGGAKAVSTA